jgi:branched-subunit amino acid aminotransferase/4-amino-4-deoxychorismate lyase
VTDLLALAVSGRGLVDPDEPVLRADDEAFARGRAVFETLRIYGGVPFRLDEHLARLARSARSVGIVAPDLPELERLVSLSLEAAACPDGVLRLYWTPGPADGSGDPVGLALVSAIPGWIEPARERGQRLAALEVPRRGAPWLLAGTKSTSYAVHIAAEQEAKRRGADDALFVDSAGIVLEGPVTNIWWRIGRTLFTPSLGLGILAGETRAVVSELAPETGYEVEEGTFPLEGLLGAEETFTSSSVRELMPVVAVDETHFPRGPAALELQAALRRRAGAARTG